ncbi:hypothetical protein FOA52_011127 [Chlamydomonas sp. UWO 241]|nr:hypothetical protein FOA52_011127 [Chlamydomonas sp. UWO 241]
MRVVCKGTRSLVDGAVQVVASPSSGASADDLASALLRWPAVRDLTLLNVTGAADLAPLSTASLAGLTSLTVREEVPYLRAWNMATPSPSVAATLRVVDIGCCSQLRSINFVRNCVQLSVALGKTLALASDFGAFRGGAHDASGAGSGYRPHAVGGGQVGADLDVAAAAAAAANLAGGGYGLCGEFNYNDGHFSSGAPALGWSN